MRVLNYLPITFLRQTFLTAKVSDATSATRTHTQSMYRHDCIRPHLRWRGSHSSSNHLKSRKKPVPLCRGTQSASNLSLDGADGCHPGGVSGREVAYAGCRDPRHIGVWFCDVYKKCGAAKVVMSAVDNEGTRVMTEAGCTIVSVEGLCWVKR